ncbi:MAG: heparinase II/III family protein, partial [Bacteroidia bacterium]|nr:heparinase II/III-family protein [Bacteroidia bacterium]MDW8158051.1 heparinase II/III family protein [Bacteroidia bacterium]
MGHFAPDMNFSATYKGITRSIRNPWYDPNYQNLYEWIARIRMPDGKMPPLEDSYIGQAFLELAFLEKSRYHWKIYEGLTSSAEFYNQSLSEVFDLRAHYIAATTSMQAQEDRALFQALPRSGNLVFRSSWGPEAIYMHVNGKNGLMRQSGGGHSQADASSFLLYAYGKYLALDAGYLSYGQRNQVGNAYNHNMILVNGTCGPPIGSPGNAGDADAFIEKAYDTPCLDFGKVTTSYCNAQIARYFLFIDNRYFIQSDFVSSSSAQSFTWQLHGHGLENGSATTGIFTRNFAKNQATWRKQNAALLVHITAQNGLTSLDTASRPHEIGYNSSALHTTLLANKTGEKSTLFLATLYPYQEENAAVIINNLNALPSQLTGLEILNDGKREYIFSQLTSSSRVILPNSISLGDTISFDGTLAFVSHSDSGKFLQGFIHEGRFLDVGNRRWIQSTKLLDLALQYLNDSTYFVYASKADTLNFYIPEGVKNVINEDSCIMGWHYDCQNRRLSVILRQKGSFLIRTENSKMPTIDIDNITLCQGQTLSLEFSALGNVIYNWKGPNFYSFQGNSLKITNISTQVSGTWSLNVYSFNCIVGQFNFIVNVLLLPLATELDSNVVLCEGSTLLIRARSEEAAAYTWMGPDGFRASGPLLERPNIFSSAAGTWQLYTEKGGCTITQNFNVAVKVTSNIYFDIIHNMPLCEGRNLFLSAAPIMPGVQYLWQGPGNFSAMGYSITRANIQAVDSGIYTLVGLIGNCSTPIVTQKIEVQPSPKWVIRKAPSPSVCLPQQPEVELDFSAVIPFVFQYTIGGHHFDTTISL